MLNIAGPWEVFGHTNDLLGRNVYNLQAFSPSAPSIQTRFGLCLAEVKTLPSQINSADTIIIAGSSPDDPMPADHIPMVQWLKQHRSKLKRIVSICTGAFALAEAGILDGHRATTHWMHLDTLRGRYPRVKVIDEGIYVKDRTVWTSAGVTAGIDLALALVEEDHGHALAMRVAKRMVLFLRRSGHQSQFSTLLESQERESPQLHGISTFVIEHICEELPVERIASHAGMSSRTLSRWCRKHLKESPASLVRRLRVAEARRLLEETPLALKEVSERTGLGDQSTLWRIFIQDLGLTPAEYRNRFASLKLKPVA